MAVIEEKVPRMKVLISSTYQSMVAFHSLVAYYNKRKFVTSLNSSNKIEMIGKVSKGVLFPIRISYHGRSFCPFKDLEMHSSINFMRTFLIWGQSLDSCWGCPTFPGMRSYHYNFLYLSPMTMRKTVMDSSVVIPSVTFSPESDGM